MTATQLLIRLSRSAARGRLRIGTPLRCCTYSASSAVKITHEIKLGVWIQQVCNPAFCFAIVLNLMLTCHPYHRSNCRHTLVWRHGARHLDNWARMQPRPAEHAVPTAVYHRGRRVPAALTRRSTTGTGAQPGDMQLLRRVVQVVAPHRCCTIMDLAYTVAFPNAIGNGQPTSTVSKLSAA